MPTADYFTTRALLPLVSEDKRAESFLRDHFFSDVQTYETRLVEFDVLNDQRQTALPVDMDEGGSILKDYGFKNYRFEAPYFAPETITTAEDIIDNRMAGETVYTTKRAEERLGEKVGRDLRKLEKALTRAEEWMCAQVLAYGKIQLRSHGRASTIDFWEDLQSADQPKTTLSGTALWSAPTTANPFKDLRKARRDIIEASGISPTEAIMGAEAIEAFLAYLDASNQHLDLRRMELGYIKPEMLANGATYWGRLLDSGLDIYSYDATVNIDGTKTYVLPSKAVIIGSPDVGTSMTYGPCPLLKNSGMDFSIAAAPRVPSSYVSIRNPAGRILRLASRPLPVVHEVYGFHTLWPLGSQSQSVMVSD